MAHHQRRAAHAGTWKCRREKASHRDWLVLTHHETGQEKEGRGHTDARAEQTTKAGSDCVNKVNSQAEEQTGKGLCVWRTHRSQQCALMCTHGGHIFLNIPKLRLSRLTTQVRICLCFLKLGLWCQLWISNYSLTRKQNWLWSENMAEWLIYQHQSPNNSDSLCAALWRWRTDESAVRHQDLLRERGALLK